MQRIDNDRCLAQKVGVDAQKYIRERQHPDSPQYESWLQSAVLFDHNIDFRTTSPAFTTTCEQVFDTMMTGQKYRQRQKKVRDVEILIQNLLYHTQRRPVAISLNRNHYKPNTYRQAGYYTPDAVKLLSEHGYIHLEPGFGDATGLHAERTKMWPTEKLLTMFATIPRAEFLFTPIDHIILKDTEKQILKYDGIPRHIRHVRQKLKTVNAVTDQALVQYIDPDSRQGYRLRTRLRAMYNNGKWTDGGRLYTVDLTKDGYQYLSEKDRQHIHIDFIPTIEWDFSGMQPRMMYALEDIQYDEDPYSCVFSDPALRPILKMIFLALLNAENEVDAVRAGNKFVRDNWKYYLRLWRRNLNIKQDIIPAFKETHQAIEQHFYSDIGYRLMNIEAAITLDILSHFSRQGIPVLGIHDSFLIQTPYSDELYQVMQEKYRHHLSGFSCPIH